MHSRKAANRCEALDELDHRAALHIGILTGAGGGPMRLVPQRIAMEVALTGPVPASAHAREGAAAFAERRPPQWKGL